MLIPCAMIAQSDRQLIREGNKLYRKGEYVKAESAYRKAVAKNEKNPIATYNLGCAMMRQNNDSTAIEAFTNAVAMTTDKTIRSKAYHNTGTILQHKKQYKDAIEAYKGALRNNPKDNDSRYNLVLCQHLLKQQQQQQQQNKQNKKQNDKDKNNDKNKENKENKDNKDQQNKNDKQQPKDDQNEKQPKRQMSRENAEQLLNAAMQQEKETQKKLTKAMQQPSRKQLDKNW